MPTQHDIRGCCTVCRLRLGRCVCADAPRLNISTRLVVIIHSKEWRRSTNTGHLARLAVKDGEVRLHGQPNRMVSSTGIDAESRSTLALYPGCGAHPLTADYIASLPRPLTLLVPDGNWNQAKNMMRRLPMFRQAQQVKLGGPRLDVCGLRHNHLPDRMSTFQAIAQALGILEGLETENQLLAFFRQFLNGGVRNTRRSNSALGTQSST